MVCVREAKRKQPVFLMRLGKSLRVLAKSFYSTEIHLAGLSVVDMTK